MQRLEFYNLSQFDFKDFSWQMKMIKKDTPEVERPTLELAQIEEFLQCVHSHLALDLEIQKIKV